MTESIQLNGIPRDLDSARALSLKKDDRVRKEFEKWAILTYSDNRAFINERKGKDQGIDGFANMATAVNEMREVLFSVKSGKVSVSQVRDLRGTMERENAAAGIFITLQPPTKDMLQEAHAAGKFVNSLTGQPIDRIKIVTIAEILAGERLYLPMSPEVLKKAPRSIRANLMLL
jgi:hypothetical protein